MMGVGRYIIVIGRWVYIFGHRPTGDVPGIPDGQSAPVRSRINSLNIQWLEHRNGIMDSKWNSVN